MPHLEMKDRCEKCGQFISPDNEAYICSYECTFCSACTSQANDLCPDCGGELVRRPNRGDLGSVGLNGSNAITPPGNRVWLVFLTSIAAWMFVALSGGISSYEIDRSLGYPHSLRMEFVLPMVNYLIFAFLTPLVFFLTRRNPIQRNNWLRRVLYYLAGGFAFASAHVALRALVYPVWDSRMEGFTRIFSFSSSYIPQVKWILVKRLFLYNLVDDIVSSYLAIVLVAHAVWYYQNFREREKRATQLESQLTKARLKALKSQLQPHFLFNTMHSISALMHVDVSAADKMITRLCDFLRINLENDEVQFTTLNRELEFTSGYLEIEKIRFEERLNLAFSVAPDTLDASVPHLLLQPVIENAIQHGISRRVGGGVLGIKSVREEDELFITVEDNGPGLNEAERGRATAGLGLKATRERLQTIYGNNHRFSIHSLPAGGVKVEFRIPFRVGARLTLDSPQPESGD